jgi:hypothetical protein
VQDEYPMEPPREPSALYLPAGHTMHPAAKLPAPVAMPTVPPGHTVQEAAAALPAQVPRSQGVQVAEYRGAPEAALDTRAAMLPAEQHVEEPGRLRVEAGHGVQLVAPMPDFVLPGQTAHAALVVAFQAALLVPPGQGVQLCDPNTSAYVPGGQPRHVALLVAPVAPEYSPRAHGTQPVMVVAERSAL